MIRIIEAILLLGVGMLMTSCGFIKGSSNPIVDKSIKLVDKVWVDDNLIEERIEDKIEDVIGLSVDLTPASPEK